MMPKVWPALRRRRLAPDPCSVRGNAVTFIFSSNGCGRLPRSEIPRDQGIKKGASFSARLQDGCDVYFSNTLDSFLCCCSFPLVCASSFLFREQRHERIALADALERLGQQRGA